MKRAKRRDPRKWKPSLRRIAKRDFARFFRARFERVASEYADSNIIFVHSQITLDELIGIKNEGPPPGVMIIGELGALDCGIRFIEAGKV